MAEILFVEQKNGYDKSQVDDYIRRLTEAYEKAYGEYLSVCDKYNVLIQDYKKLEAEKHDGKNAGVIARALIASEKLSQEIIDNAYNEEAKIVEQTKKDLEYIYKTVETAISEVRNFLASRNSAELGGILNDNKTVIQPEPRTAEYEANKLPQ